ncbi:MAG: type pilus biosis protein PilC, partial [Pseudomonadota bacterium]
MRRRWPQWRWRWAALDPQGQRQHGHLLAPQAALVRAQLRRQGLHPVRVRWAGWTWPAAPSPQASSPRATPPLSAWQALLRWLRARQGGSGPTEALQLLPQLAALQQGGIDLARALALLQASAQSPKLRGLIASLQAALDQGEPLHQALAQHPRAFEDWVVQMVLAAETAGRLGPTLAELAHRLQAHAQWQRQWRAALLYPAVVVGVALGVLVLMLLEVVPVFEALFAGSGQALPAATQWLVNASLWLRADGLLGLMALLGMGLALAAWAQRQGRLADWREACWLALPGLSGLAHLGAAARWSQTLSSLLAHGVPMAEALPSAARASGLRHWQRLGEQWRTRLWHGARLSEAMRDAEHLPPLLQPLCATGEDSGQLAAMLAQAGELLQAQWQQRLQTLTRLLEPALMLGLGSLVGAMLMALYLPIFQLGQAI